MMSAGPVGLPDSQNFLALPRKSTTVSTKGLLNMPGQNNCFLNSAVQVLWHLDAFRRTFRELSCHVCNAESCIFCALKELFTQFQYSQESALPPDALRHALAKTFCDQKRFQLGFMDDAAECFENILLRIHVHIANQESEDMCGNVQCIPHQKFAMTLVEQRMCQNCSASSEPLPFTQMVHYVTTSALCAKSVEKRAQEPNSSIHNTFGKVLRLAGEMGEVRDCPGGCGQRIPAMKTLMNHPEVVSIGLVWDSESPTLQHITDVFHSIGMYLRLHDMFHNVYDSDWVNSVTHQLVGVVTYYGKHYSTFFFHTKLKVWIYFDDATVREIGPSWEQVVEKCQRGRFQPLLLLFANTDIHSNSVARENIYSNVLTSPTNKPYSPVNQRQSVINQYLLFQNSRKLNNMKPSFRLAGNLGIHNSSIPYSYKNHLSALHNSNYINSSLNCNNEKNIYANAAASTKHIPMYSNLDYLNSVSNQPEVFSSQNSTEALPANNCYDSAYAFQLKSKEKANVTNCDFDAAKDSDSAFTEEEADISDMYISRKAVENVFKLQKKQLSLCRSYSQTTIGNRNSSSSLESFDNAQNCKGNSVVNPSPQEILPNRRDSGSWSSDRNSSSSNNSAENPFLTVVASKRLLLGLKKNHLPDSSDLGYDSFSVSSSDSYPSVNGSPVKLEPRLTQIPEDWHPEDGKILDEKLKLVTRDAPGPPDCDKLCAEADLLLAKSHEKEKDGDLVMAALLSDSAAARARAAMEAPYNNSRSLVSAKMKHSTCVMRSSNLYRRLKDHEMDERRKQKTVHHSRQSSRDSTHSKHSRQNSKDSTHSKKDSNSDEADVIGKNIEIYGTLPKKGSKKKVLDFSGKSKDDQVYKDFLDHQRRNISLANSLNETSLKNVDIPKHRQTDSSPKRKNVEKTVKTSDVMSPKSPTRRKDALAKNETETKRRSQIPQIDEKAMDLSQRDLLTPISSPDKKQHKIKRKLLMGNFMKRKNRSLPDLREDQDAGNNPIDCFLDDAVITAPSVILPDGRLKKNDGSIGGRGFQQPHHAFVKKDLTQRPLLVKVNPPSILPKPKLVHNLPSLPKKSPELKTEASSITKPSKIPFITNHQKESHLPPLPPTRSVDTRCTTKPSLLQKISAIPVFTPQGPLSPVKLSNAANDRTDRHNEQLSEKEDLPQPTNPFLAEIQAKRKQVLKKCSEKEDSQTTPASNPLSVLPKLTSQAEGSSLLKELQSKLLKRQDSYTEFQNAVAQAEKESQQSRHSKSEENKEQTRPVQKNWKLLSENTQEVARISVPDSCSVSSTNNGNSVSSVKNLASRFENVIKPQKESAPEASMSAHDGHTTTNSLLKGASGDFNTLQQRPALVSTTTMKDPISALILVPDIKVHADSKQDSAVLHPHSPTMRNSVGLPDYSPKPIKSVLKRSSSIPEQSVSSCLLSHESSMPSSIAFSPPLTLQNSVSFPNPSSKPIKSALKTTSTYQSDFQPHVSDMSLQRTPVLDAQRFENQPSSRCSVDLLDGSVLKNIPPTNSYGQGSSNSVVSRPMKPPDYATAMQRLGQIRTSTSEPPPPADSFIDGVGASDVPKKKSSKKSVTFSDEVVLVACAEYDEIDFSSNPLFAKVYQQHVESGRGEIAILSTSYGNFNNSENASYPGLQEDSRVDDGMSCNLCHNKPVVVPSSYCTDCEFYLSRFKP